MFLTQDLPPEVRPVMSDLKTVLEEIARLNQSKIKVTYLDPNKDQGAATEARNYGIQALQFSSVKSDKFEVQTGYFGLALVYGEKSEVLPVASDVGNLEYFLMSAIKRLSSDKIPAVALADENSSETQILRGVLGKSYKFSSAAIGGNSPLPAEADTLIIVDPKSKFDEKSLNKLKEWLKSGKGVIALVDKVGVDQNLRSTGISQSNIESVWIDYGIEIENKLVVDEESAIANFQSQNGSFITRYSYWPQIRPENINPNIPALSGIDSLMLAWASPIKLSDDKVQTMFSSSQKSEVDDSFSDLSPEKQFNAGANGEKRVLGVIRTEGVKLAVIGDSDFIKDQFVVSSRQNMNLLLNLVDYFSQETDLLSIRSKSLKSSPLRAIPEGLKMTVKGVNIAAPLVILVVSWLVAKMLRERSKKDFG
ncbi:hypothetical protein A3K55_01785 [Candidatus Shapirobacteria bacterium RBG_13_44_7]|uniref:Uncharacterized protein n=1 Tax=Candidatus Shapirobacteria bacterium RBG_13_44_7 TaxID=1802149 RepID=A0A1F7SHJ7_9BACT|nr:MAG: hypothetical protein A3K55_01785 [Candidatus Shapirobacteria bacterium RBG_13_44_7]